MKKLVLASLLAVAAIAVSQQQASAWVNTRFSVGLNWGMQSGGNSLLWGAWRNGQPPGPETFGAPGHGYMAPAPHGAMPQAMPQAYYYAPMPQQASPAQNAQQIQPAYYGVYQFANYPRPIYYYPQPSYYYYFGE